MTMMEIIYDMNIFKTSCFNYFHFIYRSHQTNLRDYYKAIVQPISEAL
jgi:hypothetical protein